MAKTSLHTLVDESIILKIAGGDKTALSDLYIKTSNAVYCFALSILRDTETAQDIMQETYIQVWRSAKTYKPCGKDPVPWVLGIAKYIAYAHIRTQQKHAEWSDSIPEPADPKNCFADSENKILANALLSKLGEDERQIVTLYITAGLKHREIAKLLDMPLSTVINKYNRSLKKLEKLAGDVL